MVNIVNYVDGTEFSGISGNIDIRVPLPGLIEETSDMTSYMTSGMTSDMPCDITSDMKSDI